MAQYYTTGSGVNHHNNNILNMKVSNKLHEAKAKHILNSIIYLSSKLYLIIFLRIVKALNWHLED